MNAMNMAARPAATAPASASQSRAAPPAGRDDADANDLIYPIFVRHGEGLRQALPAMPGQAQLSVDQLAAEARELLALGIPGVMLFGIPARKDADGSENYDPDGIAARAIRELKAAAPELIVFSDLCFCSYTDHGHCGIVNQAGSAHHQPQLPPGYLLNDASLAILARAAVVHAEAGADFIAPSGMLDGMVAAIRAALDEQGQAQTGILSYAAKFASSFYGPFQHAAENAPTFRRPPYPSAADRQPPRGAAGTGAGRGRGRRHADDQARAAVPRRAGRRAAP